MDAGLPRFPKTPGMSVAGLPSRVASRLEILVGLARRFFGPTTVYAFRQALGLVNDHLEGCDMRGEVMTARERFTRPLVASID